VRYVYLDQNKWIDLAKAAAGRADGARFARALKMAKEQVRAGDLIFPLSAIHIIETAKSPRLEQRQILARLMTELSQGVVLRASSQMLEGYVDWAVREFYSKTTNESPPQHFARGVEAAFDFDIRQTLGIPERRAAALRSDLDSPEAWIDLLAFDHEAERKAGIDAVRTIGINAAKRSELVRAEAVAGGADLQTMRRAYGAGLTMQFLKPLEESLRAIGRSVQEWGAEGPDKLMEFWTLIPFLSVELELHTQKHWEKSKEWEANDVLDIGALSLAIPSCDVVVTERFWVNLITKRGLAERYNARVLYDVATMI